MLDRIRFVLVNTSHPGNIGSAARAMKTMGLSELYLVAPHQFPSHRADEMSSGAHDVLKNAIVVDTLEQAVADCTLVVGASARVRTIPWPFTAPRAMAEKIKQEPLSSKIAVVFGNEQSGLSNEELQRCQLHVTIPANPEYSSLNLAAAVQVLAYELRVASLEAQNPAPEWDYRLANADEMEKLFQHMEQVLVKIDFLKLNAPRKLMTRLRRFFFRARPDVMEMNIFRGMLTAVEENVISRSVFYDEGSPE
ncbi:MAG TPA: tRNA (cytosine(32)/uridine(32)-2'-O)-methyltransferase TrmJ [Gammaproteobacteria bacterium]|nr:tRNA (cytosine(32)/uridine(32)-2'-O)-methyltransferase TrmJ [Gammaproteobacteria bacterium]